MIVQQDGQEFALQPVAVEYEFEEIHATCASL